MGPTAVAMREVVAPMFSPDSVSASWVLCDDGDDGDDGKPAMAGRW